MRDKALVMIAVTLILATSAWASSESVLYNFDSATNDGLYPQSQLVADKSGHLYGTTEYGGSANLGTVFELSSSGGVWTETILYSFTGGTNGDGAYPLHAPLAFDKAGNLYGETSGGGSSVNAGTVFELTPSGGGWKETVLHVFAGYPNDGYSPQFGLTSDTAGNFYGTTYQGGKKNLGAVFEMKQSKGKWSLKVIHSFGGANGGAYPLGGIVAGKSGYFYGATSQGGVTFNAGIVYRMFLSRNVWVWQSVYRFSGGAGGTYPESALTMDATGNFYGTTYQGGDLNLGTVYKLTLGKNNKYTQKVLYSFKGYQNNNDGSYPQYDSVTLDAKGNIYGTTYQGGSSSNEGTVYELKLASGKYKESVLHGFVDSAGSDGYYPQAGVILVKGVLYGVTYVGGTHGYGIAFAVTP
jgi:uncharacterized repeat protein (TIGR03803 family)